MNHIGFLKNEGHKLLEEYISLDSRAGYETKKRTEAYRKLEKKLLKNYRAHFRMMTTEKEVLNAIQRLRQMIDNKIEKMELRKKRKAQFAPNLQKIQKEIVFTKVKSAEGA